MIGLPSEPAQSSPIDVRTFSGPDLKYELLSSQAFPTIQGLPDSPDIAPIKRESLNLYKRLETYHIIDPQAQDAEKSIPLRNRALNLCLTQVIISAPSGEVDFDEGTFAHYLSDGYIDVLAQLTAREEMKIYNTDYPQGLYPIFKEDIQDFEAALKRLFTMSHKVSSWEQLLKQRIEQHKKRLQEKD